MAKVTIGFEDYEEPTWEEYTGEDPKVGSWHTAVLKKVQHKEDEEALLFILEIDEGDFKGWGRGVYAPYTGERKWKVQQTLRALQGGLTKTVTVDWDNEKAVEAWVKKQKPVRIKIGSYNERVNIDKVSPLLQAVGAPGTAAPKKEAETVDEVDAGDEAVEDYTAEELGEMSVKDLEEVLTEEFEFEDDDMPEKGSGRGAAAKYKAALIEAVLEAQEDDEDKVSDDEEDDEDGEEGDEDFEDGFEEDEEEEPEPEPEPAKPARRSRAAKAAPAKAAPAPAAAPARRRRR